MIELRKTFICMEDMETGEIVTLFRNTAWRSIQGEEQLHKGQIIDPVKKGDKILLWSSNGMAFKKVNAKEKQQSFLEPKIESIRHVPTNEYCDTSVYSRDKLNKNKYRKNIYEFISEQVLGATCDEVEKNLNIRHQTASCFIRFLTQDNLLRDSGDRRLTRAGRKAIVWKTL